MEKQNNRKKGTFGRLLRYIFQNYRIHLIVVICCIIVSAAASVVQTVFLQRLIDTCILPGLNETVGRSWFNSEVIPTAEDRVITLSTCSYEFNNARFVLIGRMK